MQSTQPCGADQARDSRYTLTQPASQPDRRYTDRQTDRQTQTDTDRHTHTHTHTLSHTDALSLTHTLSHTHTYLASVYQEAKKVLLNSDEERREGGF